MIVTVFVCVCGVCVWCVCVCVCGVCVCVCVCVFVFICLCWCCRGLELKIVCLEETEGSMIYREGTLPPKRTRLLLSTN